MDRVSEEVFAMPVLLGRPKREQSGSYAKNAPVPNMKFQPLRIDHLTHFSGT
jgi:hypothetical protein